MKSASRSSSSSVDELDADLRGAGRLHVGVVGDDLHAEGAQPLRDEDADPAEADDADDLLGELDAGVLAALPLAVLQRGVGLRDVAGRGAAAAPTASSAADTMLEVGALTTMTPAWVAALTSTLSRPTPARATTFSFLAAAIASASTLVAERTRIASTSAIAGSSSARSAPSQCRISKSGPRASTVAGESSSAMSTTGLVLRQRMTSLAAGGDSRWRICGATV